MVFDPNPHHLRLIVIRCGQLLNPMEKNVTVLYDDTAKKVGVIPFSMTTLKNSWETAPQLVRQILITAGQKIRDAQGLSPEENLEKLAHDTAIEFGLINLDAQVEEEMQNTRIRAKGANKLPAPHEMKDEQGKFTIPRKDCPQCGRKDGLSLKSICPSCTDSEGGKYHSMYSCEENDPDGKPIGCGLKTDKSEKFMVQRMSEENPDWAGGMKQDMGIMTITNEGIK